MIATFITYRNAWLMIKDRIPPLLFHIVSTDWMEDEWRYRWGEGCLLIPQRALDKTLDFLSNLQRDKGTMDRWHHIDYGRISDTARHSILCESHTIRTKQWFLSRLHLKKNKNDYFINIKRVKVYNDAGNLTKGTSASPRIENKINIQLKLKGKTQNRQILKQKRKNT